MKKLILLIIIPVVLVMGIYFILQNNNKGQEINNNIREIQGMKIETLKEGAGAEAKNGDTVTVHYTGTLENGTKFDSSLDSGTPFSFTLGIGEAIQGWDLGVLGMKMGEKRKLTIPSELGYGSQGVGGVIPPNATLIFEVELLGINQ
jgi:FKBP-type peptidyl-prolyl cis-trans isomerase